MQNLSSPPPQDVFDSFPKQQFKYSTCTVDAGGYLSRMYLGWFVSVLDDLTLQQKVKCVLEHLAINKFNIQFLKF